MTPVTAFRMDPNLATVMVALIAAVVAPLITFVIKFVQDRDIAREASEQRMEAAEKVAAVAAVAEKAAEKAEHKLEVIHDAVNGGLASLKLELSDAKDRVVKLEELLAKAVGHRRASGMIEEEIDHPKAAGT